jgi:hypothetical protein
MPRELVSQIYSPDRPPIPVSKVLDNSIRHNLLQSRLREKSWRLHENPARLQELKPVEMVNDFVVCGCNRERTR